MLLCTNSSRQPGAIPILREGSDSQGQEGGQGKTSQTLKEKWSPHPQTQRQMGGGLSPSDTKNNLSPTDPIHPQPQLERPQ